MGKGGLYNRSNGWLERRKGEQMPREIGDILRQHSKEVRTKYALIFKISQIYGVDAQVYV